MAKTIFHVFLMIIGMTSFVFWAFLGVSIVINAIISDVPILKEQGTILISAIPLWYMSIPTLCELSECVFGKSNPK